MRQEKFHNLSDEALLSLTKKGNQVAFNQIYNRYWKPLFVYVMNILHEKHLAEDAIHEIFCKIWINRQTIEISNLKSYLFVAIRNKAISLLGKVTFTELDEKIIDSLSYLPDVESNLFLEDLKTMIETAARDLPERCQEIFFMSRFKNFSNAEIADYFQISTRTVENQLSLALKHIRTVISKDQSLI